MEFVSVDSYRDAVVEHLIRKAETNFLEGDFSIRIPQTCGLSPENVGRIVRTITDRGWRLTSDRLCGGLG